MRLAGIIDIPTLLVYSNVLFIDVPLKGFPEINSIAQNTSFMQRKSPILVAMLLLAAQLFAQVEPTAGNWKTWFIPSGQTYRLPAPPAYKDEIAQVLSLQQKLDAADRQQIMHWNAGAPGYHWQHLMGKLWMNDASYNGALANMLLNVAIYDATIVAWDTKYAHNRPRPFVADKRIKALILNPQSPSYPCEHSVAAGVATTIIAHFYPALADSVQRMAQRMMASRIAAGVVFPSDTRAGFELGKKIAEKEIKHTKDFTNKKVWDGKMPTQAGLWKGKYAVLPLAGLNKTVVLDSSSQFRPGPPPDFAKDMEELKKYKPSFSSIANAFHFASESVWEDLLEKKIFENNLHLNPPRAARIYAIAAVGIYDGFTACWDAKYTYWGTRPDQYDTTFQPVLIHTPPFPGYPSGHAAIGGVMGELYAYFFPAESAFFRQRAKDGAESRFQGGIHFRTDNEVGLELGRKVGAMIIQKVRADGADNLLMGQN
ncbi:phosphoesterase PA-phosphatase related protein [Haliscomenobacter hydrossis DSM 1100]|uniref:Phosphoesterase PA-phosphatase related protein n=2 Tax=Haliscomenobacter TaxID=2349 RepID=F4KRI2_HALH1|nr:phosphoesterase PA-phosphatase related protein [Haliscomenobacter hydrossis DSM 1100]